MRQLLRTQEGFGAFYEENSRELLTFFARRVYDPQIALDLTAETFASALRSVRRLRATTAEEAKAWLYGIARNQLHSFYRHGQAEKRALRRLGIDPPALDEEGYRRVEELAEIADLRKTVVRELARLSESERSAVELRVVEQLSYSEVAVRLEISELAARARVSRGLRALATALDSDPVIEELT
jgi:RNA polymerase sigma-70 factor (ECF subfamily)